MKKITSVLALAAALFAFGGCDSLDIENIYSYDADKVWNDEKLANAYLTDLYGETFGNWATGVDSYDEQMQGISLYPDMVTTTNDNFKNWNYTLIRRINDGIERTEAGSLAQGVKDGIIAQCEVLRAYTYFNMVKYHGGVPYITHAQDRDNDDLYVTRNSTAECFDLIIKDLDDAIAKLPDAISKSGDDYGRVDGCFARALKGRVLLYKASPQFHPNHPWDNADWQTAYNECKSAYEHLLAAGYHLCDKLDDIFLTEAGPEVVFAVINKYPNKVAGWWAVRPGSLSRDGAYSSATWEMVKEFPMADGKQYDDPTGKYYVDSEEKLLQNFWKNRDPRFTADIIWNGEPYSVNGTAANRRQYTALGIAHELDDFGTNPAAKVNSTNLNRNTGFFIRKGSDPNLTQAQCQQFDIDYQVMRFAEVMLNYAETANEAGHQDEAIEMLRQIRHRAGIEPGADGNYGIDASSRETLREAIIQERNIEFCFEGYRFWDLRRLRMLDRLDNKTKHAVEAIAINADGSDMSMEEAKAKATNFELTEKDFRYVIHQIPFSGVKVTSAPATYYFFPIKQGSIDRNSKLEQNKDWGGTFNPALD